MKSILLKLFVLINALFLETAFVQISFAQEVDTLFTTPEERAYLDFLREEFLLTNQANDFNIDEVVPAVPVIEEVVDAPVISSYTLGGIFTRQDGTRTVWLNGINIDENNLPANMSLIESDNSTLLEIQLESGRFDLRAGQTLDVVNSQILESWQLTITESVIENPDTNSIINTEIQVENQLVEITEETSLITLPEEAPPIEITSDEIVDQISALLESENPADIEELRQALQLFQEAEANGNSL